MVLLCMVLTLMLGSTFVYMTCEGWSFLEALFFSVSIGYSVGMVPQDNNGTSVMISSDVAIVYTCVHALFGGLIIAAAAALLVQQVLMRDEKFVRREYERATKEAEFRTAQTTEHGRPTARSDGRLAPPPPAPGAAAAAAAAPRRWCAGHCFAELRRWHLVVLLWWLLMLVVGYIYGLVGEVPGREEHKASPRPFALLWAVSSLTGLGAVSPNNSDGGLLFATFFVVVGVPLNAAFLAMIVDIYLSYVQRTEARRKVLANPLGRATFFDIAATRSTLEPNAGGEWPRVVTWPVYLEHKLRELASERTTLSDALLDTIHESFLAMGGRKGYLMLDDLAGEESAEVAALAGGAHGGVGTGGSLSGSFCDGGPLTPNSRARSWHGVNDASSPMRHLDEQLQQHIDSPDHHV